MRMPGRVGVLREQNYRRLFIGRTVSLVGDGIAPVAIAFAVLDLTNSATDLGVVLAAHSLMIIALILVGGVFADRISPRVSMLRADLVRMVVTGLMAALLISGSAQIWQLVVLYAIEGGATAFFNPASNAIVPSIVSSERLQEATALLNLSRWGGRAIGPAVAGILLALGTPGWALAVDAATFAISAYFLFRLKAPGSRPDAKPAFVSELRHGWREFCSRTWLWVAVIGAAFSNAVFFPAFQVLGPAVARDSLGGSSAWALIAAAFGTGALVGGVLALYVRPRRPLLVGEAALVTFAAPVALLAIPSTAALIALAALAGGAAISVGEILYETTAAQHIPQASLSRVSAYDWFGSLALEPLGLALIGPLAVGIGTSTALWAAAAVMVVCQIFIISVPSVRRLEARPARAAPEPVGPTLLRPIEPGD
jgi:predicted MFS family arabinose efflux permease